MSSANSESKEISLGQRIRQKREALGLTQLQLAKALDVTPQHLSVVELNKRNVSVEMLAKLAQELGTTIDFLVTGKESAIIDIIPAIKADQSLGLDVKNALSTLVKALQDRKSG